MDSADGNKSKPDRVRLGVGGRIASDPETRFLDAGKRKPVARRPGRPGKRTNQVQKDNYRLSPDDGDRQIFEAAGADAIGKKPKEASDSSAENNLPSTEQSNRRRRSDYRRDNVSDVKKVGRAGLKAVVKSKGNIAKAAVDLLRSEEFRSLASKYRWELFWSIIGDLCDLIPFVGFIFNWLCWAILIYVFGKKDISYLGKMTKGAGGMINIIAEVILSPIAFYPGLLIGTIMTIADSGQDTKTSPDSRIRRQNQRRGN